MEARVTVVYGKQSSELSLVAAEGTSIAVIDVKRRIEALLNVPVEAQKLLCKGKELKTNTALDLSSLPPKVKIMLLCHPSAAARATPAAAQASTPDAPVAAPFVPAPSVEIVVAAHQIRADVVRGKDKMAFALDSTATVGELKVLVAAKTQVPPALQRLLSRGKYPSDDIAVASLVVRGKVTFMLLFDERQHIHNDVARSTDEMTVELTAHEAQFASLLHKVQRNFFDQTDLMLTVAHLIDQVEILQNNALIAMDIKTSPELVAVHDRSKTLLAKVEALASQVRTRNG
ncbi:hypothetical protein ACHHYP_07739 [Achlya hypogyna]|uniref:Ubiquitin-like domain-containing protein n=1 Tax=Achlya hypogyna TaxID=1202772 RepID=A0A1V9ZLJ1_ACHHY|nr:hypothetical protein ACHHYP_07739 [Achlya hypogyna]